MFKGVKTSSFDIGGLRKSDLVGELATPGREIFGSEIKEF